MANIKHLSDKGPDGTSLGQSSTDLISFYGATPVVRQTVTLTAVTALATTVLSEAKTGMWGFGSSTVAQTWRTRVNQLIVDVTAIKTALGTTKMGLLT